MTATVIAFIPGTTASELNTSSGNNVWPAVLNSDADQAKLAVQLETSQQLAVGNLVSYYPMSNTDIRPCYYSLLQYVQGAANFTDGVPFDVNSYPANMPTKISQRLFYAIPYDWRQNNTASADWVNTALAELHKLYGSQPYNLYIFAHSMGGLISRYVLEKLAPGPDTWAGQLKGLFTFGTPHLGAPLALDAIIGERIAPAETDLVIDFIKLTVNKPVFPSTYELLPPTGRGYIVEGGVGYTPTNAPKDMATALTNYGFKSSTWTDTASVFLANLSANPALPSNRKYHLIYGDATSGTVSGFNFQSGGNSPAASFVPQYGDGDTVVPTGSASLAGATSSNISRQAYAGYTHGQLAGSDMDGHPHAIVDALNTVGVPARILMQSVAE